MGRKGTESDVMGLDETAEFFRVHRHTIRKCVQEGTLPALKLGRVYAFSRRKMQELLEKGSGPRDPEPGQAA